jgi:hypothetical protein
MKIKIIFVLANLLLAANILIAQSDYEIVQEFKEKSRLIEQAINDVDSIQALDEVGDSIDQLNSDFAAHKELLDNGLYPSNFNNTIEKLRNLYSTRNDELTNIEVLQTEVSGLREEVDTLNRRNSELSNQFRFLETQSKDDRTRIAQLENAVSQLKASLQKRDQVVMNMIDSLLPREGENLSQQEKQEVFTEAEKNNILFHIKKAVRDNIRFLEATKLYPDDIEDIKDQQENFSRIWKSVGPTMVELYSEKGKNTNELKEIDNAFTRWHSKVDEETWESIDDEFTKRDINLRKFSNGKEFAAALTSYIDDEIKTADEKEGNQAEASYKKFADTTWYADIKNDWVPFLKDNNLLADEEEDSIEVMIASWRDTIYPGGMNWLYIVVGVLIIAIVAFFFARKSPRQSTESSVSDQTG